MSHNHKRTSHHKADGIGASSDDYDEEIHLHTQPPDVAFVALPRPADSLPPTSKNRFNDINYVFHIEGTNMALTQYA